MKIYIQTIALISGLLVLLPSAMAHPGHTFAVSDGHVHSGEYAVIAVICVALLGCFATILWRRGQ